MCYVMEVSIVTLTVAGSRDERRNPGGLAWIDDRRRGGFVRERNVAALGLSLAVSGMRAILR